MEFSVVSVPMDGADASSWLAEMAPPKAAQAAERT